MTTTNIIILAVILLGIAAVSYTLICGGNDYNEQEHQNEQQ